MNILQSAKWLFSKTSTSIDFEESVRRRLFVLFSMSILIPLIPFGILHLVNGAYVWGCSIFLTSAAIIGLVVIVRLRKWRKTIYRLSVMLFLFLFTYWTYTGTIQGLGSLWFLGTSPYIFFLLGKREGTAWCMAVGCIIAVIFFNPLSLPGVFSYSLEYSARYLILYFIIFLFTHYYESTRERYKNAMLEEHGKLLLEKEQLLQTKNELEHSNTLLNEEIVVRKQAQNELMEHKENLERMIAERTSELSEKNTELQASEKRYRLLADNINDVIWMANNDLSLTYISPSVEKMLGYSAPEAISLGLKQLCIPESFDQLWHLYEETLKTVKEKEDAKERHLTLECKFFKKDKNIVNVEITLSLIIGHQSEVIGVGGITRDIGERVKSQREKEKIQIQLAQSQKMEAVGTLAGGVAHDFNNMLSAIIGYSELSLQEMNSSNPLRKNLDRILDAARRSANLTRQLLAFARKQTIVPEILDINEAVGSVLKMIRRLIGENIELAWLPGTCSCRIKMDPTQIDQILVNLCVNARDAISGVGRITIETGMVSYDGENTECRPGTYVLLSVSDNGQGMDRETLNHIFEPFFTTKKLGAGTGMGLATVYGIVKQNKGMINVYSEAQLGTTFKIYLPCYFAEPQMYKTENIAEMPQGRGETILMVEDDPMILEMGKEMLQKIGYKVISANTPFEAMRLTEELKDKIHLVLTDVIMPEMNGRELMEKLQKIRPDIKYMYMSGYTADIIARQGVLDQGIQFIQKPFSHSGLAAKVREAICE